MRDSVFKSDLPRLTVEMLKAEGEKKDVVYNIVTKYDTRNGYEVSIKTSRKLETAMKVMKNDFEKESLEWMKGSELGEEEIARIIEDGVDYEIGETSAFFELGDDYLSIYITSNEIITEENE